MSPVPARGAGLGGQAADAGCDAKGNVEINHNNRIYPYKANKEQSDEATHSYHPHVTTNLASTDMASQMNFSTA